VPVAQEQTVPIQDLVLIPELNPRARLCEETIIRYMESFPALPPVRVQAKTNVVVDGYHRVEAAVRLGLEEVAVRPEEIPDDELRLVAVLGVRQPLSRTERNQLAVVAHQRHGKLREEVAQLAQLLGVSGSAVTLALREHQFNEQLSEKLGSPVQVINSAHVRALYRVGAEQRERLLEAVVSKVDEDGQPYPLTGAELKVLVDRMLDPATPTAELNRLLNDPKARPKPPASASSNGAAAGAAEERDPFVAEGVPAQASDDRPWEREWESPLKGGDSEAFDRVRSVDEDIAAAGGGAAEERQLSELLRRAETNAAERDMLAGDAFNQTDYAGNIVPVRNGGYPESESRLRDGIYAATRALEELVQMVQPAEVRSQVEAVVALLRSLGRE